MNVRLCRLRGARVGRCLSKLWWRFRSPTYQAVEELKSDNFLGKDPASTTVKHRPVDVMAHESFAAVIRAIPPEKR